MVNTVATLLIPKYCIFIFTPRHVISHVISSSIGDVPDKNFATPFFFFFFCMTYTKRMRLKSQTHLHWPLVVLFPLLGMFSPSICLSRSISSAPHQPNLSQSSELLSILQKPSSNTSFPSLLRKNLLFSPVSYHRIIIYVACLFL